MAIKLEGEGGKAFMAWPLVEELFCGFPKPLRIKSCFLSKEKSDIKVWGGGTRTLVVRPPKKNLFFVMCLPYQKGLFFPFSPISCKPESKMMSYVFIEHIKLLFMCIKKSNSMFLHFAFVMNESSQAQNCKNVLAN